MEEQIKEQVARQEFLELAKNLHRKLANHLFYNVIINYIFIIDLSSTNEIPGVYNSPFV